MTGGNWVGQGPERGAGMRVRSRMSRREGQAREPKSEVGGISGCVRDLEPQEVSGEHPS